MHQSSVLCRTRGRPRWFAAARDYVVKNALLGLEIRVRLVLP